MLTQSEVDDLVTEAKGGVENSSVDASQMSAARKRNNAPKKVRPYNFWSPDRFSKEQMRAVELVHEDLAERLTSTLPQSLRGEITVKLVHIEQGRFDDFLRDLPPTSLYHLISLKPLSSRMVITLAPDIAWMIMGKMLGGKSEPKGETPSMTDIGQSLLEMVIIQMLDDVRQAWGKVIAIEPELEDATANRHWIQMMMGNVRVMLVTFQLVIDDMVGSMSLYIPFSMLKPLAKALNPHVWISGMEEKVADDTSRDQVQRSLSDVMLPVRVQLGTAQLNISEVANLQVGDILCLDSLVSRDLTMDVSNRDRFKVQVGKLGKRLAVQITSIIRSHHDEENLTI
jgi:flagellar motor switch protein FliM